MLSVYLPDVRALCVRVLENPDIVHFACEIYECLSRANFVASFLGYMYIPQSETPRWHRETHT